MLDLLTAGSIQYLRSKLSREVLGSQTSSNVFNRISYYKVDLYFGRKVVKKGISHNVRMVEMPTDCNRDKMSQTQ